MFSWISSGRLGDGGGGVLAVVLQDGGNRAVEAGAEHQRPSAGGVSCGYPYRSQGAILALRLADIWQISGENRFTALVGRGLNLFALIRALSDEYVRGYETPKTIRSKMNNNEPLTDYTIY